MSDDLEVPLPINQASLTPDILLRNALKESAGYSQLVIVAIKKDGEPELWGTYMSKAAWCLAAKCVERQAMLELADLVASDLEPPAS